MKSGKVPRDEEEVHEAQAPMLVLSRIENDDVMPVVLGGGHPTLCRPRTSLEHTNSTEIPFPLSCSEHNVEAWKLIAGVAAQGSFWELDREQGRIAGSAWT